MSSKHDAGKSEAGQASKTGADSPRAKKRRAAERADPQLGSAAEIVERSRRVTEEGRVIIDKVSAEALQRLLDKFGKNVFAVYLAMIDRLTQHKLELEQDDSNMVIEFKRGWYTTLSNELADEGVVALRQAFADEFGENELKVVTSDLPPAASFPTMPLEELFQGRRVRTPPQEGG